jgi:hypothetical protein
MARHPLSQPFKKISPSNHPASHASCQRFTCNPSIERTSSSATGIKEEAKRLLEKLPDDLTWDDLMHEIYVRQSIEAGLADSEAGKVVEVSDVRKQFGLPS